MSKESYESEVKRALLRKLEELTEELGDWWLALVFNEFVCVMQQGDERESTYCKLLGPGNYNGEPDYAACVAVVTRIAQAACNANGRLMAELVEVLADILEARAYVERCTQCKLRFEQAARVCRATATKMQRDDLI